MECIERRFFDSTKCVAFFISNMEQRAQEQGQVMNISTERALKASAAFFVHIDVNPNTGEIFVKTHAYG